MSIVQVAQRAEDLERQHLHGDVLALRQRRAHEVQVPGVDGVELADDQAVPEPLPRPLLLDGRPVSPVSTVSTARPSHAARAPPAGHRDDPGAGAPGRGSARSASSAASDLSSAAFQSRSPSRQSPMNPA